MDENTNAGGEAAPRQEPRADVVSFIEAWWADHFPGSPVAEITAAWNTAHAAKENLKQRLAAFLNGA